MNDERWLPEVYAKRNTKNDLKDQGWLPEAEIQLPYDKPFYFYQMCYFPDMTKRHLVRRYLMKSPGKYLEVKDFKITHRTFNKLIREMPLRQYKIISSYDLSDTPLVLNGEALLYRVTTSTILAPNKSTLDYTTISNIQTNQKQY